MYILFTILIVIASILLTLLVLVQNSKGGGLASGFASSNQVLGVRKTTDFLEKATWTLVAVVLLLSVGSVAVDKNNKGLFGIPQDFNTKGMGSTRDPGEAE